MTPDEEKEILAEMRAARAKARGYADFFGWATDRDIEEWGVVTALAESLEKAGESFFSNLKRRGRPNDPPDCEAISSAGARIAIEVTELVDGEAIRAFKLGRVNGWADWGKEKLISVLAESVSKKDDRFPHLKEPPYDGGYIVVVHTDEPMLSRVAVGEFLSDHRFEKPSYVDRAFLVLSYDPDPAIAGCPYFELAFKG